MIITRTGFLVLESPCLDPTQWRIERIASKSSKTCHDRFGGKRCNVKIAKYQHSIAAPTFLGIEKSKSSESWHIQVWFCPPKLDRYVLG